MGSLPRVSRAVVCLAAFLVASGRPTEAGVVVPGVAAVCAGSVQLTFSAGGLSAVPAVGVTAQISSGALDCGAMQTATISSGPIALSTPTSCVGPLAGASSNGVVNSPVGNASNMTVVLAGTTVAPQWAMLQAPGQLLVVIGAGVWTDAGQITACAASGITTVSLTAVVIIAT